jgi:hypothetical protein
VANTGDFIEYLHCVSSISQLTLTTMLFVSAFLSIPEVGYP